MNIPQRETLPLKAAPHEIHLTPELLSKFNKAFASKHSGGVPPTFAAVALKGVFEMLNAMNVNWKGLLHATQSFEYLKPVVHNQKLRAETSLVDARLRGGMHWLQFEARLKDALSEEDFLLSKSLIMVKAES